MNRKSLLLLWQMLLRDHSSFIECLPFVGHSKLEMDKTQALTSKLQDRIMNKSKCQGMNTTEAFTTQACCSCSHFIHEIPRLKIKWFVQCYTTDKTEIQHGDRELKPKSFLSFHTTFFRKRQRGSSPVPHWMLESPILQQKANILVNLVIRWWM